VKLAALALAFAFGFAFAERAAAAVEQGHWLRDHFTGEWLVGTGGWRTSIGVDTHAPGFDELGGGTELSLGFEVGSGFAILGQGRVIAGGGYLEGTAALVLQLHVSDRVRVRAGPSAGRISLKGESAALAGGFLAGSVDLFAFGGGRVATTLGLRFDVDGLVDAGPKLPSSSISLAIGVGLRY
jgi:hypothetical protein